VWASLVDIGFSSAFGLMPSTACFRLEKQSPVKRLFTIVRNYRDVSGHERPRLHERALI